MRLQISEWCSKVIFTVSQFFQLFCIPLIKTAFHYTARQLLGEVAEFPNWWDIHNMCCQRGGIEEKRPNEKKYLNRKDLIKKICYVGNGGLEKWITGVIILGSNDYVLRQISRPKTQRRSLMSQCWDLQFSSVQYRN